MSIIVQFICEIFVSVILCSGRYFDGYGNRKNWWQKTSNDAFNQRAECFVDQYNQYQVNNRYIDGLQTLDENVNKRLLKSLLKCAWFSKLSSLDRRQWWCANCLYSLSPVSTTSLSLAASNSTRTKFQRWAAIFSRFCSNMVYKNDVSSCSYGNSYRCSCTSEISSHWLTIEYAWIFSSISLFVKQFDESTNAMPTLVTVRSNVTNLSTITRHLFSTCASIDRWSYIELNIIGVCTFVLIEMSLMIVVQWIL